MMDRADYLNKVMFSYELKTEIGWDLVSEQIGSRFGHSYGFDSATDFFGASYRINKHIKSLVNTEDNFYSRKRGYITREFGP